LLTRRDHGTAELRGRLLAKGFAAEAVEQAIARGIELGYLDDARYVERLSRDLLASGRAAGPRLALELRRRGLPEELIGAALSAARAGGGEETALRELIARRFPAFNYADADAGTRRRVVNFLQRRGFPLDRILNELKRTDS
jgi:regulatory protein